MDVVNNTKNKNNNNNNNNKYKDWPFQLVFVVIITVTSQLLGDVTGSSNLYANIAGTHNGDSWGQYCYDRDTRRPSCGWKMIVSVSYTTSWVEVWQSTATKIDDYTFRLTPTSGYEDVSARTHECHNLNIKGGSFGGTEPDVSVTYSCICTEPTNGCEEVPYVTVSPWDAPPAAVTTQPPAAVTTQPPAAVTTQPPAAVTTQPPAAVTTTEEEVATTQEITVAQQTTDSSTNPDAAGQWDLDALGFSSANVTSIKLVRVKDVCYNGGTLQTLTSPVEHFPDCGSFCLRDAQCEGVNYYMEAHQCVLVRAEVDEGHADLADVAGCQFWKVLWKQ